MSLSGSAGSDPAEGQEHGQEEVGKDDAEKALIFKALSEALVHVASADQGWGSGGGAGSGERGGRSTGAPLLDCPLLVVLRELVGKIEEDENEGEGGQMGVEDEDTQCPDIHGIEVDVCIAFTKFWHGLHAIEQGAYTALALASSNM